MEKDYLRMGKDLINRGNLVGFQHLIANYLDFMKDKEYARHEPLFRDLFVHMCLRGKLEMAQELMKYYQQMSVVDRIGLSPTFNYCRTLARKRNDQKMLAWLEELA